ncbi:MAG: hypothetical protein LBR41_02280 [Rickettsiales bacterium]|jgi:hypothetical protein|nr:hypothetical protein [Rickettsiales bacterium]
MKERPAVIAQRLINICRQAHVIPGGWARINKIIIEEATEDVVAEMPKLPCGVLFLAHLDDLKSGRTPMNTINREISPYGGMMESEKSTRTLSESELAELSAVLEKFQPDAQHLEQIKSLPFVAAFGAKWLAGVRASLHDEDLIAKWRNVYTTHYAMFWWNRAREMLSSPATDITRAQVQADLPEYETYMPMFGETGQSTLAELRAMVV